MEEILASIRRIIAEDAGGARPGAVDAAGSPAGPAAAAGAEVLLLTEMVAEDGTVVSLAKAREASAGATGEQPPQPKSETTETTIEKREIETVSAEKSSSAALVSDQTAQAATAAFSELARTVVREPKLPGGSKSVEDLVREALEPMLKSWLDANLAPLVERVVRQEIQKMVRRAEEV